MIIINNCILSFVFITLNDSEIKIMRGIMVLGQHLKEGGTGDSVQLFFNFMRFFRKVAKILGLCSPF